MFKNMFVMAVTALEPRIFPYYVHVLYPTGKFYSLILKLTGT
jgi:hypothetical protein